MQSQGASSNARNRIDVRTGSEWAAVEAVQFAVSPSTNSYRNDRNSQPVATLRLLPTAQLLLTMVAVDQNQQGHKKFLLQCPIHQANPKSCSDSLERIDPIVHSVAFGQKLQSVPLPHPT
ncbi:hypothetical protein NL676_021035 [Syzygium grande]|nr:hypothetical protein NL676_021035 [Syzygium grande]